MPDTGKPPVSKRKQTGKKGKGLLQRPRINFITYPTVDIIQWNVNGFESDSSISKLKYVIGIRPFSVFKRLTSVPSIH
jgi:hypothetical protein